jgi:hypothetical protein
LTASAGDDPVRSTIDARPPVSVRNNHQIWIEQCEAARSIKLRYGVEAAFDYVVAEKLLNFAEAAARHPEFTSELPRFVSEVRCMFTPREIGAHLARIEREQIDKSSDIDPDDDVIPESPVTAAARRQQFATVKELLTATALGTS